MKIVSETLTMMSTAFGLVAALAWNEVIKPLVESYIRPYFGKGSGLVSLVIYAVVVTVVAVVIATQLGKFQGKT